MAKRERDDSEEYRAGSLQPDEYHSGPSPSLRRRSSSPLPRKNAKVKKEPKAHKASSVSGGGMGGKTMWDAERSAALVEAVFETASKAMDTDAVANKVRRAEEALTAARGQQEPGGGPTQEGA